MLDFANTLIGYTIYNPLVKPMSADGCRWNSLKLVYKNFYDIFYSMYKPYKFPSRSRCCMEYNMGTKQRKVEIPFSQEEMRNAFKTVAESRAKRNFSKFNTPVGKRLVKSI
ncbi:TPA: hypothetical protein NVD24_002483 [Vibrio cholerae]|nr:hypothetical protein [Vibrio cholerae]